jgi:hypothetical protein
MASHSIATDPAGNFKPVKPDRNRGSKRIDGVVASIMAVSRSAVTEDRWVESCLSFGDCALMTLKSDVSIGLIFCDSYLN